MISDYYFYDENTQKHGKKRNGLIFSQMRNLPRIKMDTTKLFLRFCVLKKYCLCNKQHDPMTARLRMQMSFECLIIRCYRHCHL